MITDPQLQEFDPAIQTEIQRLVSRIRDSDHLQLLMIGYYILGAMAIFFVLAGFMYAGMGIMFAHMPSFIQPTPVPGRPTSAADQPDPRVISTIFEIIGGTIIVIGSVVCALHILSALSLSRRKHYLLIMITAGIICLSIPFGTALGVATFVVLGRPSVKQLFGNATETAASATL